jgi:hypothetical protein
MQPLTLDAVQRALVNVTKRERNDVATPAGFEDVDWSVLDFFGWRDPKFPQRGYLVHERGNSVVAVAVSTDGALPPGRKAMCNICRAVDNSTSVALFSARRAGAAGRNGNTIATYICSGLDCSEQLRRPTSRVGRIRLDNEQPVDDIAADMLSRLDRFITSVMTG